MSQFDCFRARAETYRQMATELKHGQMSADMHELAEAFDAIADNCDDQWWNSPFSQRLFSSSLVIL